MTEAAVDRWRWTVEHYEQAFVAGLFGPEPHVELIDGEVYEVPAMLPGHATTVIRLNHLVDNRLDETEWSVRCHVPVRLDDASEPEPDLCVARGPTSRYDTRHPGPEDVVLVVEVSDTTLAFDRTVKLPHYARCGVPEVWIVSLLEHMIHRFTHPTPASGTYDSADTFAEEIDATTLPLHLAVSEILPNR